MEATFCLFQERNTFRRVAEEERRRGRGRRNGARGRGEVGRSARKRKKKNIKDRIAVGTMVTIDQDFPEKSHSHGTCYAFDIARKKKRLGK